MAVQSRRWQLNVSVERQVKQLGDSLISREWIARLDDFAQARVSRFYGVGGVDDFSDFRWVVEERCDAQHLARRRYAMPCRTRAFSMARHTASGVAGMSM